jgi:hypothetical protein
LLLAGGISAGAQELRRIVFAEAPALLVNVDGEPTYRPIPGSDLERLANTRVLIVRDTAHIHYLKVLDGWMESYLLMGDWSVAGVSPFRENAALERTVVATVTDRLDTRDTLQATAQACAVAGTLDDAPPTIVIATEPASLIVTDGPLRFETFPGTSLQYLANTRATVFREPTDQEMYVRTAANGDWYRAWTADGPWHFVPADQLPSDIARQLAK